MQYIGNIILLFLIAFSARAQALVLCSYAAYTPSAIRFFMTQRLNDLDVVITPSYFFWNLSDHTGKFLVVGNSMVNGSVLVNEDRFNGVKSVQFFDSFSRLIGHAEEKVSACRLGICRTARFRVVIGGETSSLVVRQSAERGVEYFVDNGGRHEELNVTLWRSQFDEQIHWLMSGILDFSGARLLAGDSPLQSFAIVLASDPVVAPYLDLLRIHLNQNGNLVISGRITHGVYNRIIDQAIRAGFYNIEPHVVIDSAVVLMDPLPPEDLRRCM
jgi:hypothetical protein